MSQCASSSGQADYSSVLSKRIINLYCNLLFVPSKIKNWMKINYCNTLHSFPR